MDGWHILDLASNIYWVMGIFIFFTILLHMIFVWWYPLSMRAWKLADYLWLTLAFLSTLGLVGDARQYRAQSNYSHSEQAVSQSLENVRNWYSNYQIYICAEAKILQNGNLTDTAYHHLCDWLEGRINDLNLLQKTGEKFPELFPSVSDGLTQYSVIISSIERKILYHRIEKYNDKRILYLTNAEQRKRSSLQMIILILAPVMLAFALAIRFTKVTAEYRLLHPDKNGTG